MNLATLRINQLSTSGWDFYQQYLTALDRYDVVAFTGFLADDVTVQFNNAEPMIGKQTAALGLGAFWKSIQDMGFALLHEPLNIYGTDQHFVLEALNHYTASDGRRVTVRAVAFTDRNAQGEVASIRVYQDLTPLYAPPAG